MVLFSGGFSKLCLLFEDELISEVTVYRAAYVNYLCRVFHDDDADFQLQV